MRLYLLRHADAEPLTTSDVSRALTPLGFEQAGKVARFCKSHGIIPDLILSSPFLRAQQTAQAVTDETATPLETAQWLASGMSPEIAISEIKSYARLETVMIAGHEPDFSQLAAALLGLDSSSQIHIRKASLTAIEWEGQRAGNATLEFLLPVKCL